MNEESRSLWFKILTNFILFRKSLKILIISQNYDDIFSFILNLLLQNTVVHPHFISFLLHLLRLSDPLNGQKQSGVTV